MTSLNCGCNVLSDNSPSQTLIVSSARGVTCKRCNVTLKSQVSIRDIGIIYIPK